MLKTIFLTLFFVLSALLGVSPKVANAEGEFITDSEVTYLVNEDGTTHITHNITLENAFPTLYAKSYSLELVNIDPKNIVVDENGSSLSSSLDKKNNSIKITAAFPNALVGKGAQRNFQISFDADSFTEKNGEVWEVSIPKLSSPESFRNYSAKLIVPKSFGELSYVTPDPLSRTSDDKNLTFVFNKESISSFGVKAGFGEFQVFSYVLNYHLENPLSSPADTEIALPPDTAFQKIYLQNINPKPEDITYDQDGNWIAKYALKERQRLDVIVSGTVQIFANPREFLKPSDALLSKEILPQKFWESDSPKIAELANLYKTPKGIYDFVVGTLSYNYDRVKPNVQRLGAQAVLSNPTSAICMEYTDLFIAIARAAKIPAREINGYAYSDNPKIKPLSLVSDVLHAWPEYWDSGKKVWVAIDPTWQDTTGGADFFNKLDLRHFTFVIHGADPQKPYPPGSYKLGANPQKDVFVNLGHLPDYNSAGNVIIKAKVITKIPFFLYKLNVGIQNTGLTAIYNKDSVVYFDNRKTESKNFDYILPYTERSFEVDIPFSFFGLKTPQAIAVSFAGVTTALPGTKSIIVITNLIAVFIFVMAVFTVAIMRSKRIKLGFLSKIRNHL